ncbi:MAG: PrpR N-terminal domain-containing protein [Lachnospiraceae bacterium]|nr:PrpR N-terminal domain-containing protein [Lachnospiraceae bacterium]
MSGIALFVPTGEMYEQAQQILKEQNRHHVVLVKQTADGEAAEEAGKAVRAGANIIIARGRQAYEIRQSAAVPVVEIVMSAQELGLLAVQAREQAKKPCPVIGLFGWEDMLPDTSYFETLYGVKLRRYVLKGTDDWRSVIAQALKTREMDAVIGGEAVMAAAAGTGIPALYLSSTGESIRTAIKNAESLYCVTKMEQYNYAQFSTVLDSISSGIIKIGVSGRVLLMNRSMEQITGISMEQAMGMPVVQVLPGLEMGPVRKVLSGEEETWSAFLNVNDQSLVVVAEPIVSGERIDGAILSCSRMRRLESADKEANRNHFLRGHVAYGTFDDIDKNLKGMQPVIERAKIYAQSSSPMLIEAITGPELDGICQGIHNYSLRRNGPFITVNVAGLLEEQQMKALFGGYSYEKREYEPGLFEEANHGTLVIQSIDKLTLPVQYNLMRVIRTHRLISGRGDEMQRMDTRIIGCTAKNLTELRKVNRIRADLYYTLKALRLKIPNLAERPEDVGYLLDFYIKKYSEQYSGYHVMSAGARRVLLGYPWEGNSIQLDAFCERMILTVGRRVITEGYVRELLHELYETDSDIYPLSSKAERKTWPECRGEDADGDLRRPGEEETEKDFQQILVEAALKKYDGNRTLAARELGISTTTLWRRMKKYELE